MHAINDRYLHLFYWPLDQPAVYADLPLLTDTWPLEENHDIKNDLTLPEFSANSLNRSVTWMSCTECRRHVLSVNTCRDTAPLLWVTTVVWQAIVLFHIYIQTTIFQYIRLSSLIRRSHYINCDRPRIILILGDFNYHFYNDLSPGVNERTGGLPQSQGCVVECKNTDALLTLVQRIVLAWTSWWHFA